MDLVGLAAKAGERVRQSSGGQQRRLDMAVALAGDPELLFLDEPTTGFDPAARHEAWEVVKNLATLGKTILLTTHYMDEAQLPGGSGRGHSPRPGDRRGDTELSWRAGPGAGPHPLPAPQRYLLPARVADPIEVNGYFELRAEQPGALLHRLTGWALETGTVLEGLEVTRPTLEDVYLALTADTSGGEDR